MLIVLDIVGEETISCDKKSFFEICERLYKTMSSRGKKRWNLSDFCCFIPISRPSIPGATLLDFTCLNAWRRFSIA